MTKSKGLAKKEVPVRAKSATSIDVSSKKRGKIGCEALDKMVVMKKAKREVDNGIDYISDLPEPVLHHILSYLHPKDAARMCALSKRWRQMWNSYLVLDVDLRRFQKMKKSSKETYMKLIENWLTRRKEQSLCIHKFRLRLNLPCEFMYQIRSWVKTSVQSDVREVEVQVKSSRRIADFILPPCLMQASSITALNLCGCRLPTLIDIKLPQLQKLSLKMIHVPPLLLQKFISGCPHIDDFRLVRCSGLKKVAICTLDKLKRVDLHKCNDLRRVVIEAPRLEAFWYYHNKKKLCEINLSACRALKQLVLEYPRLTDEMFQEQFWEFPSLEKLVLSKCDGLKSISIVGDNLRDLAIRRCRKLVQAQVDAPHLTSLEYRGPRMPFTFLSPRLNLKEAQLSFELSSEFDDASRLRNFYDCIDPYKGLKLMTQNKLGVVIYEDMRAMILHSRQISKPYAVNISASFIKLLHNGLKTSPYPSTISVMSHRGSDFPEIIYKELTKGKAEPKCCGCFTNKCWRHYLNNVSVENWIFESSDWAEASTSLQWKKTTLTLDWNIKQVS